MPARRDNRPGGMSMLLAMLLAAHTTAAAQARPQPSRPAGGATGGGSNSTVRFISPVVVASWMRHWRASDGDARSLLVLWRGTPGWFAKRPVGGPGGSSSSGGGGGSTGWQTFSEGGLSFELAYDFDRNVVTLLKQEVSLVESNVVLVDLVDSTGGAQIVDRLWVETPAEQQPQLPDPIFAIVKSSPRLYEYVGCDVTMPGAIPYVAGVMAVYCAQMRPQ